MFQPRRILITRQRNDAFHDQLQRQPGLMMQQPSVGESLQIFLETGKVITTTPIIRVNNDGEDTVVDTRNSRYRLKQAS